MPHVDSNDHNWSFSSSNDKTINSRTKSPNDPIPSILYFGIAQADAYTYTHHNHLVPTIHHWLASTFHQAFDYVSH